MTASVIRSTIAMPHPGSTQYRSKSSKLAIAEIPREICDLRHDLGHYVK